MAAQFSSNRSFVDAPFFSELSRFKLETARLSEDEVPLNGLISPPQQAGRPPAIRLTAGSFGSGESAPQHLEFRIPGNLLNQNTLDAFRELDKRELLRVKARDVGAQIRSGEALSNPALLAQFALLTFAELKKYKFFYWFMFPSLSWTSSIVDHPSLRASAELDDAMASLAVPVCLIKEASTLPLTELTAISRDEVLQLGVIDFGSIGDALPWHLRNVAALLSHNDVETADIYIYRSQSHSRWIRLNVGPLTEEEWNGHGAVGWERNSQNKLVPKLTDLSSLMDPQDLANQAVNLNLKLMKWRAAPLIDLEAVAEKKCLLLGAGTLGSYVARGLLAWGVHHITFVDNGKVSYSNPVRQPLYTHDDCVNQRPKAESAAQALSQIFPGVTSKGYEIEIPMAGHPIMSEERQQAEYKKLVKEIEGHDVIFLLMDSRESRWLPTVICQALGKVVINVALGFDSYLVMRHGVHHNLGCYYCNDVVAPSDSISRLTLDQMCTVTRPGVAMLASGYAVELMAQIMQHPERGQAQANASTVLGPLPHQLRGFLNNHETMAIWGPAFPSCSACGSAIVDAWREGGWNFVKRALNDPEYVTELSGLGDLQRQTADLDLDSGSEGELD